MTTIMECNICEQEIRSDVTVKEYCALCSMSVHEEEIVEKFGNEVKHFCCNTCKKKFIAFYKKR